MSDLLTPSLFDTLVVSIILMGLFGLTATAAFAQHLARTTVSGDAKTPAGKPLEFATILLLKAGDSTLVKGAAGDADGHYSIDNVMPGTYRISVTGVGYQKAFSAPFTVETGQAQVAVPTLVVQEDSRTLGEVKVTAKKPFIEQLADKTVVNVENSIVSAGGTALDVLEKAPGVLVDTQNDRISLKGRTGTLVMIDGKPTYLSAQEVVNLLRNTPSNGIQSIELISNPSAKYDAAGNAGIINIRLKRGTRNEGTSGSATVGSGYGRFPKASAGLTLNHRAGGWSLFGNYNYDYNERFGSVDARRIFGKGDSLTTVRNLGYRPSSSRNHTFKAGADYALGKRTSAGLMLNGMVSDNQARIDNSNLLYNAGGELQQNVTMVNASTRGLQRIAANVNVKHTFDTLGRNAGPRELTVDADYSYVSIDPQDNMRTRFLNAVGEEVRQPLVQRNTPPSQVTIRAGKFDYVHPLSKSAKLEAGGKISYVTSDNDARFETLVDGNYVIDPQRTNHFLYDETISAAYLNGSKDWQKWSLQGGLRMEHTRSLGNSVTLNKVVDRNYVNLFPSVFMTYTASKNHQWRTSYSRRIDRPNYQDLNPFVYVMDTYTYYQGNPFLRPQYTDAFQVGYTYKGQTTASLSYNHTTDVITGVNEQMEQIMRVTTVNLASLKNINLNVGFPLTITKWWNTRQTVDVFYNAYDAEYAGERLDYRQVSANVTSNHSFVLPHGFTAELSGFYNSPFVYGMLRLRALGQVSVGVQKTLWNKTATVRLNVSDLFQTMRPGGVINHGTTNVTFTNRFESRVARLTFTYNFGNRNIKGGGQRRSSAEEEQRRIGGGGSN
ncbi:TonB-dependent receptor domain-containing protein [Fibrisoma montanum]|nr:TonB-dependent receptor [Fibrisoma montanum]